LTSIDCVYAFLWFEFIPKESRIIIMSIYYQKRDAGFIDYEYWPVFEKPKYLARGPRLNSDDLKKGNYFSVVGAAETVGVHAAKPYGALLGQRLQIPYLNLANGGASIEFFNQPKLIKIVDTINRGKFLVVTLMSARQISNSLFKSKNGLTKCVYNNQEIRADDVWKLIVEEYWEKKHILENTVSEIRESYVNEYVRFLKKIRVPVVLFYFSQREPRYSINWRVKDVRSIWGGKFPHLVNDAAINKILSISDVYYVKCVSGRGIPYQLKNQTGNAKAQWNPSLKKMVMLHFYYPSPEMHEDAAEVLVPVCKAILSRGRVSRLDIGRNRLLTYKIKILSIIFRLHSKIKNILSIHKNSK
jgi:hypothetical protein